MTGFSPHGVHLVGSVNLPTTLDVFHQIPTLLPDRLRRLPDGETGERCHFVRWQAQIFQAAPEVLIRRDRNGKILPSPSVSPSDVNAIIQRFQELDTQFDKFGLESYELFKQVKKRKIIPSNVRFQISLPGIVNVMCMILPPFQLVLEPLYEAALSRALENIQRTIPHEDLAIQIDASIEFALMEGAGSFSPYFEPIFRGVVERLARFASKVHTDVELGFHLCYGDIEHEHFVQPYDTGLLVEVANALQGEIKRPIQWFHMPVPTGRKDSKFFAPLKQLVQRRGTELYLGVVHAHDEEGTRERIAKAAEVVKDFGVATECGMGRTPVEHFDDIMKMLKKMSLPAV